MDKMTFAAFEDRYAMQLNKRFLGLPKRMTTSIKYEDYMEARFRVAPIQRMTFRDFLFAYTETVSHRLRRVYSIRKGWKRIGTVDAIEHFRGIK